MENASQALIIAGAILLAILLIAVGMFIFNKANSAVQDSAGQMDQNAIQASKQKFESYQGKISGTQLKALIQARDITPTDGNGVKAGGDLAQIAPGCTYEQVDTVLAEITQPRVIVRNAKLIKDTGITHDSFKLIEQRYWNSEYKRAKSPHIINPRDFYYIFKK